MPESHSSGLEEARDYIETLSVTSNGGIIEWVAV